MKLGDFDFYPSFSVNSLLLCSIGLWLSVFYNQSSESKRERERERVEGLGRIERESDELIGGREFRGKLRGNFLDWVPVLWVR